MHSTLLYVAAAAVAVSAQQADSARMAMRAARRGRFGRRAGPSTLPGQSTAVLSSVYTFCPQTISNAGGDTTQVDIVPRELNYLECQYTTTPSGGSNACFYGSDGTLDSGLTGYCATNSEENPITGSQYRYTRCPSTDMVNNMLQTSANTFLQQVGSTAAGNSVYVFCCYEEAGNACANQCVYQLSDTSGTLDPSASNGLYCPMNSDYAPEAEWYQPF